MRLSRVILIVVVILVIGLVALFAYTSYFVSSPSAGSWSTGPNYPLQASGTGGVVGQSCVNGTGTIYCIGGIDYNGDSRNDVYSATVSSSGMSDWTTGPVYPQTVGLQSCVSYNGYAYCVGGSYDDAGDDLNASYYTALSGSTAGSWSATTSYPIPTDSQACVASSGYIYCVGGENETNGHVDTLTNSTSAWFAPLTSTGIGAWTRTTAYPNGVWFASCAASSTDIYCVGGTDSSNGGVDDVYFAPLTSSGVGQWSSTTAYPIDAYGQTCVVDLGSIICVGGVPNGTTSSSDSVYSAPLSSTGVGSWHKATNYPVGIETACTVAAGNLYCMGGYQDSTAISEATYFLAVRSLLA